MHTKFGPPKIYETVIIVPIAKAMKEKLQAKTGKLKMSEHVRKLIAQDLMEIDSYSDVTPEELAARE